MGYTDEEKIELNKLRANEIKSCSKCGFTGEKGKYFQRAIIKGLYQYSHCKKCQQEITRAWRYKLTVEELRYKLNQATNCGICGNEFFDNRKVIDHCHSSGIVREVLCDPCNTTLGHLEKEGMLDKFLNYLNKHNKHEYK